MKKLIVGALLAASAFSVQAENIELLNMATFVVNPEATTIGPKFKNTPERRAVYGDQVATLLLKNADKLASKYLDMNDPMAYNAFLVMALTVPMHEGFYVHFRETANVESECVDYKSKYKKLGGKAKKEFKKHLVKGSTPFLVKCSKVDEDIPTVTSIMRAILDGSDIGMMQISVRWHYDVFLAQRKFESVEKTIDYGLRHLMKGFDPIYRKSNEHTCLTDNGSFSYQNLVRATWGGFYNGGSVGQACRFSGVGHANDRAFKKNLDKTLAYPETGLLGYNQDLRLDLTPTVKAAVVEVIKNLRNGTDNRSAINKLLKK